MESQGLRAFCLVPPCFSSLRPNDTAHAHQQTTSQGPPGTGKTHTALAIIESWLRAGQGPVLATSESNIAVDNLVDGLANARINVVRMGRPEAVRPDLNEYVLDFQASARANAVAGKPDKEAFRQAAQSLLRKAEVVCATCSGAGSEMIGRMTFQTVLLDEASQVGLLPLHPRCV